MDKGHHTDGPPSQVKSPIPVIDLEKERAEILRRYRSLLRSIRGERTPEESRMIRKAFNIAVEAHKEQRRKTGEPYIYHPIAVARICAEEIGLGATSVVAALLHDTVEDTDLTFQLYEVLTHERIGCINEAVAFALNGLVKAKIQKAPLSQINKIFNDMRKGKIVGRMVLDLA